MSLQTEKIQKVLARSGVASRRGLESMIRQGRVTVNQEIAHLGQRINCHDEVLVDGVAVNHTVIPTHQTLIYNKPCGEICSRAAHNTYRRVFDALPALSGSRWVAVGRLDVDTSGLLLFTTHGELAYRLMHPRFQIIRQYEVQVAEPLHTVTTTRLLDGIELDDGHARLNKIKRLNRSTQPAYTVAITEGRNREVRRLFRAVGHPVIQLKRVAYGAVRLSAQLSRGHWHFVQPAQYRQLCASVGLCRIADKIIF